jgi:Rieske 2Fe-2S family protein
VIITQGVPIMLDHPSNTLASLLARRKPGYSLDAPFYTDPEIFAADMEIIFGRHWIYVGVEPDLPEAGDTMTIDIGGRHAVLLVRHDDMSIKAYHNVCRHRGSRLVHDYKSSVGNLVCRYHAWTYSLDGDLLHAEHMAEDFDKTCFGLKKIHLRSLGGLLFICLAEEPPTDFDDLAAAILPRIAPHDLPNCKIAKEIELIEPGNWKLTMENNRECYHCAGTHPELCISLFEYGFGFAPTSGDDARRELTERYTALVGEMHARWEAQGLPSREIERLTDITGFRSERLPLDGSGESQTMDTRVASRRPLGKLTEKQLGGLSFWTQPNSWHHFMSDHIVTFTAIPLDAERTLVRTKWLVHKDAVEGVDYDPDNLTAVWVTTNAQDSALVGYTQAGARSSGYQPGPYSPYTEGLVEKFCAWYVGRMTAYLGG